MSQGITEQARTECICVNEGPNPNSTRTPKVGHDVQSPKVNVWCSTRLAVNAMLRSGGESSRQCLTEQVRDN